MPKEGQAGASIRPHVWHAKRGYQGDVISRIQTQGRNSGTSVTDWDGTENIRRKQPLGPSLIIRGQAMTAEAMPTNPRRECASGRYCGYNQLPSGVFLVVAALGRSTKTPTGLYAVSSGFISELSGTHLLAGMTVLKQHARPHNMSSPPNPIHPSRHARNQRLRCIGKIGKISTASG